MDRQYEEGRNWALANCDERPQQRAQERGGAVGAVLIENEQVQVIRWDFPKNGVCTGWNWHGHDYIWCRCLMVLCKLTRVMMW